MHELRVPLTICFADSTRLRLYIYNTVSSLKSPVVLNWYICLKIYRFGLKIVGQNTENNETASKEWNILAQAMLTIYYRIIYLRTRLGHQHHRLWSYHQIWDIQMIQYVHSHLHILQHMLNRGIRFFLALIVRMATTRSCDCSHKRIKILSMVSL